MRDNKGVGDIMPEEQSSMDLYNSFAREVSRGRYMLKKSDLEELMEVIRQELIVCNSSSLINAAYMSCRLFFYNQRIRMYQFDPSSFYFSDSDNLKNIPSFDAWWIIILLSEYIYNGFIRDDVESLLPYFFDDYEPQKPNPSKLLRAFQNIDEGIRIYRKKMYEIYAYVNEAYLHDDIYDFDKKQIEEILTSIMERIEQEKETLLDEVRNQAEEEYKDIVNAAHVEAKRIIQSASFEADKKISIARKKCAEMIDCSKKQTNASEHHMVQQNFSEVRSALMQANEMIKKLEDTMDETSTKKVSNQLLELFNLIADSKETTIDLARNSNDQNLENIAYNMEVFLDMIIEYMADYDIQAIISGPGEKFSPKYHAIESNIQQFDPRSTSIKVSKRAGFLWGDQVLQKEIIII